MSELKDGDRIRHEMKCNDSSCGHIGYEEDFRRNGCPQGTCYKCGGPAQCISGSLNSHTVIAHEA